MLKRNLEWYRNARLASDIRINDFPGNGYAFARKFIDPDTPQIFGAVISQGMAMPFPGNSLIRLSHFPHREFSGCKEALETQKENY